MQQLRSTFKINNRIKQSLQILFALLFILLTGATKTFAQNKIILAEIVRQNLSLIFLLIPYSPSKFLCINNF